jgi:alpha-amylase
MSNKRYICLYFQVHQPFRLRRFRFFDIGRKGGYFDDAKNHQILHKVSGKCYMPTNALLQELVEQYQGAFRFAFSFSGTVLQQLNEMAPQVLSGFQRLAGSAEVEVLAETYAHSLSALVGSKEFEQQVLRHSRLVDAYFGKRPEVFRNTELIYSDAIGQRVRNLGYKGMLTEGADRILGWKSPNYLYSSATASDFGLLLKNYRLSDDIAFRFSQPDWKDAPLTAEKFVGWLNAIPEEESIVNLFMDYETFGEHQWASSGIFDFLRALPEAVLSGSDFQFVTPSEALQLLEPVGSLSMPEPVSWADEARDLSAWLGNPIQDDAFESLYRLEPLIAQCTDTTILNDWQYLQTSDHFYYMCTKYFADGDVHKYFNPYETPYEAFINYMNVLADFELRVKHHMATKPTGVRKKRQVRFEPMAVPHRAAMAEENEMN